MTVRGVTMFLASKILPLLLYPLGIMLWGMLLPASTFRRAGVSMIPAPTHFVVVPPATWTPLECLPDAGALAETTRAIKEYLGLLVYRLRGWA